tara:strand:+ start:212 stop:982 length:771 start_codon:yes stop_codon:yes gene_type:complete
MKSQLIILGCGSSVGVPRIDGFWGNCKIKNKKNKRTRCSALIKKGSNTILIDTSPDVKYQLLSNKIKNISSVVFTHKHADQTNGLFELRPFFWKYKKKINIYGNFDTIKYLKKYQSYLFKMTADYPAIIKSHIIKSNFSLGYLNEKVFFKTFLAQHGKVKSSILVFENTAYISDCNDLSIVKRKELTKLKYLIIDCLKLKSHPTHFNLKDSLFVHKILKPKKTILTNLHYELDYNNLLKKLPDDVFPAYDGLKLNL